VNVYIFFCLEGKDKHYLGTGIIIHKIIRSAVKRVEFDNGRMSGVILF
jgi:hypothetical protein